MVSTITLRLDRNSEINKESKMPFKVHDDAKECYREGELSIRKCAGPGPEEMMLRTYEKKRLEEDLDRLLNNMEKDVSICDSKIINISDTIARDFAIIDERIRTGLLIHVDRDKLDSIKNRFNSMKSQFIDKCKYKFV